MNHPTQNEIAQEIEYANQDITLVESLLNNTNDPTKRECYAARIKSNLFIINHYSAMLK